MPPANIIVFTDKMVTSSVGVQTSCPASQPQPCLDYYGDINSYEENGNCEENTTTLDEICPSHFTDIHRTKLEDTFSKKQKPDDIQLQIIAMECNLLYNDVRDWFKARRIKWIEDLVRKETNMNSTTSFYKHRNYYSYSKPNKIENNSIGSSTSIRDPENQDTHSKNTNNTNSNSRQDKNNNELSGIAYKNNNNNSEDIKSSSPKNNGIATTTTTNNKIHLLFTKNGNRKNSNSVKVLTNMVAAQSINDVAT